MVYNARAHSTAAVVGLPSEFQLFSNATLHRLYNAFFLSVHQASQGCLPGLVQWAAVANGLEDAAEPGETGRALC
jgi:hypothetical protein